MNKMSGLGISFPCSFPGSENVQLFQDVQISNQFLMLFYFTLTTTKILVLPQKPRHIFLGFK